MGHTLDSLITKVVVPPEDCSLWLVELVEVLFSRTPRCANDTCFVGEPWETANILYNILLQNTRYCRLYLSLPHRPIVFKLHFHDEWTCTPTAGYNWPAQQQRRWVPALWYSSTSQHIRTRSIFYFLALSNLNTIYIGSTNNLVTRLRQHNSGYGSAQTAILTLWPWALLLVYVTGFNGDRTSYTAFEESWNTRAAQLRQQNPRSSVESIVQLAAAIIAEEQHFNTH
jgi:hypothetical protein